MKHSIVLKFIAVFLCAASLMGMICSAAGIFAMAELGLYERSFDEAYEEYTEIYADMLAYEIAQRYASMMLGGCDAQMADAYYGNFWSNPAYDWSYIGYTLKDADGEILQNYDLYDAYPAQFRFTFPVGGNYVKVLSTMTEAEKHAQEMATAPTEEAYRSGIYVGVVPEANMEIYGFTIRYSDGSSEGTSHEDTPVGYLFLQENGNYRFDSFTDLGWLNLTTGSTPVYLAFQDNQGVTVYEAAAAEDESVIYSYTFTSSITSIELPGGDGEAAVVAAGASRKVTEPTLEVTKPTEAEVTIPETTGEAISPETTEGATVPETTGEATVPETTEGATIPETTGEPTVPETTEVTQPMPTAEEAEPPSTAEGTAAGESPALEEPEAEAAPETADFEAEPTAATEYGVATAAEGVRYFTYYDYEIGESMVVEHTYAPMPEYTVEIAFAPGAMTNGYEWQLLHLVYVHQKDTLIVLGVCLLVFIITLVYLCCAAGRKPGRAEIRAGGLNCIPLDLYLGAGFLGEMALFWAGQAFVPYLLRKNFEVALVFGLLLMLAMCLLLVGFTFASAAQFKTPGGYWWRNSLCGRCLRLMGACWKGFLKGCVWMGEHYDSKLEPALIRFFKACWKLLRFFWGLLVKTVLWLVHQLLKGTEWSGNKLVRFVAMLPVTWQWLLSGFILIMMLIISVDGFKDGNDVILPIGLLIAFGMILYGAHCFGVLLDSAKRMSKGDLDEKVDDKLLIGSFREFADELNGLADVAVVAAQKQLKSERMKTELITNVSHDIKTPLTSIINYVDLLQKPHTEEEQETYLEVLDRQSQRLKKLIEDLMEMSKASTGNLAVDIQKVDAAEAINQALGEFSDKLDKAQLIPVFRQPETPIEMMADGRLVWRVMSNLLGNAVKYALPGTRVYLDLVAVDGKVIISMKNISREELNVHADELLERFVRGDVSRNTEGSGLGLNIAQSLMELQKGQLQLLVDGDLFKVTLIFPGA